MIVGKSLCQFCNVQCHILYQSKLNLQFLAQQTFDCKSIHVKMNFTFCTLEYFDKGPILKLFVVYLFGINALSVLTATQY